MRVLRQGRPDRLRVALAHPTNSLIALFHDEILAHRGEVPNFASFLRVTAVRYLRRKLGADAAPAGRARPAVVPLAVPR